MTRFSHWGSSLIELFWANCKGLFNRNDTTLKLRCEAVKSVYILLGLLQRRGESSFTNWRRISSSRSCESTGLSEWWILETFETVAFIVHQQRTRTTLLFIVCSNIMCKWAYLTLSFNFKSIRHLINQWEPKQYVLNVLKQIFTNYLLVSLKWKK